MVKYTVYSPENAGKHGHSQKTPESMVTFITYVQYVFYYVCTLLLRVYIIINIILHLNVYCDLAQIVGHLLV